MWPQQPSTAPATEPPKIEGSLINLVSGEPVRKGIVTLGDLGGGKASRSVSSDSAGRFLFDKLEPGLYRLSAERVGFIRQEYGARPASFAGEPLSVSQGQSVTGLVFKLTPQAAICGKVVDDEGEAVPGASVIVLRDAGSGNTRRLAKIDWTTTNDLGEFRIPALSSGRYFIAADSRASSDGDTIEGSGATMEGYAPSFYPGTTDSAAAAAILVEAGQTVPGINIQLSKTRLYRIQGRLLSSAQSGAGRQIQVMLLPMRPADVAMGLAEMTTMASAEGSFVFQGVQPGPYYLLGIRNEGQARVLGRMPIEVAEANLENLVIPIREPLEISGRIRAEGATGAVLKGIVISLLPSKGLPLIPPAAAANEAGAFHITGVAPDSYRLNIAGLPEGTYVQSLHVGGVSALGTPLDLSQVPAVPPIEVVLGEKAGVVAGEVLNDGKPVQASVNLVPEPARPNQPYLYKQVSTGPNGRFQVTGLAPGEYKLYALEDESAGALCPDPECAPPLEVESYKVTVRPSGRESVQLSLARQDQAHR